MSNFIRLSVLQDTASWVNSRYKKLLTEFRKYYLVWYSTEHPWNESNVFRKKNRNLDILSVDMSFLTRHSICYWKREKKKEESITPLSVCMSRTLYYNDQILSLTTKVTVYFWCQSTTGFYHFRQQLQICDKKVTAFHPFLVCFKGDLCFPKKLWITIVIITILYIHSLNKTLGLEGKKKFYSFPPQNRRYLIFALFQFIDFELMQRWMCWQFNFDTHYMV